MSEVKKREKQTGCNLLEIFSLRMQNGLQSKFKTWFLDKPALCKLCTTCTTREFFTKKPFANGQRYITTLDPSFDRKKPFYVM